VFAVFFSAAAAGQYWFVRHKLHESRRSELWNWAEGVREAVAYGQNWNLTGFRRTTQIPDTTLLQSRSGTLIDAEVFIPALARADRRTIGRTSTYRSIRSTITREFMPSRPASFSVHRRNSRSRPATGELMNLFDFSHVR
jgi:hypothetical protein